MPAPVAVLDACVLYPLQVRNLFMHLATGRTYRPRWTDAIHDEWTRSLQEDRPDIAREAIGLIRDRMNAHFPDATVTGYENLIPALNLPDVGDRHVLAAAVRCGATAIVTFNLTDFPPDMLAPHAVEAVHPDEFVVRMLDPSPVAACASIAQHRAALRNPPKSIAEFLAILEHAGFVRTVAALRPLADSL